MNSRLKGTLTDESVPLPEQSSDWCTCMVPLPRKSAVAAVGLRPPKATIITSATRTRAPSGDMRSLLSLRRLVISKAARRAQDK